MNRNSCVGKEQRTVISLYYNANMKRAILPTAKKKIVNIPYHSDTMKITFRKIRFSKNRF